MPGMYREKACKFCEKLFRKRGPYCSQSCANRDRPEYSANVSISMRKVGAEYNRTPEAIARQKMIGTSLASLTADDFAVAIPDLPPELPEGYDQADKW